MILEWRKYKMFDYICEIKFWCSDIELHTKVITTIEDDIYIEPDKYNKNQDIEFQTQQLTESLLYELLKEDYGENVELIDFKPVNVRDNLYRFEYDNINYDDAEYI
jgi:hypothetical protein